MSKIHHFQRYSQYENVATNNTLQLISRIYGYSPLKVKLFLNTVLDFDIDIGLNIVQQIKGPKSVPDGVISQSSFKIIIEAKVGAELYLDQLLRHVNSFGNEEIKVLIALTKKRISENEAQKFDDAINQKLKGVIFKSVTYEDFCNALDGVFKEHEYEIIEIVNDYKEYCEETGLIPHDEFLMRIVPTGPTFKLNNEFHTYYHPTNRGYTHHRYLGFYTQKAVRSIMKVEAIIDAEYIDNKLEKKFVSEGKTTDEFDDQIIGTINQSRERLGWDISKGHRFFCSSESFYTNYIKVTPGGIQGHRFVNLKTDLNITSDNTEIIANELRNLTWR